MNHISCTIYIGLIGISLVTATVGQESRTYDEIAAGYTTPTASFNRHVVVAPTTKPAQEIPKRGVVNYDIYRDRNPFPIDPRKPCQICTERKGSHPKFKERHDRIYGFQGRPYREVEPGGCLCGKKKQKFKHLNANVYWPTFLAGIPESIAPAKAARKAASCDRFRLVDIYDHLGSFKVSGYQRKDNGYCGPGRDPYGCLGESRTLLQSNVRGVGFREPGQPASRGGVIYP